MEILVIGCVVIVLLGTALGVSRIVSYTRERNEAMYRFGWEMDVTFGQLLSMRKVQP